MYELKETQEGVDHMCREMDAIYNEGTRKGLAEGREQGQLETFTRNLKVLMANLQVSADEAMGLLNVSEALKPKLKDLL